MKNASLDWSRWALVAPNDDTGIGRMAQDVMAVLPLGRHIVTASGRLSNRPCDGQRTMAIPDPGRAPALCSMLDGIQGVVFIERLCWPGNLLAAARKAGVRIVCVPMWEWFRGLSPQWGNCDFFACPNLQCLAVVRSYGFENSDFVPWALDLTRFPKRLVAGPASHFVHNAGLVDPDDRKATADVMRAFARIPGVNLRLTVRMQKSAPIAVPNDGRIDIQVGNLDSPGDLYRTGDVFVQPSKLEGMGFMILEPVASGLPTITLNSAPMNEWVRDHRLLAKPSRFAYSAYSSAWIEHSHLRLPNSADLSRKMAWAASADLESISCGNRDWAEKAFARDLVVEAWRRALENVVRLPASNRYFDEPEPAFPCHRVGNRLRSKVPRVVRVRIPIPRPLFSHHEPERSSLHFRRIAERK